MDLFPGLMSSLEWYAVRIITGSFIRLGLGQYWKRFGDTERKIFSGSLENIRDLNAPHEACVVPLTAAVHVVC